MYFPKPPVAYMVQTPEYSYRGTFGLRTGALTIDFSDLSLFGDPGGSIIRMRTPGGGRAVNNNFVLVPPWANDAGTGAPPAWLPSHAYVDGQVVVGPGGHTYAVKVGGGGVSGVVGPTDINPATCFTIVDGGVTWALNDQPYYGQMFRLRNDSAGNPCKNIRFRDIILDGDGKRNNTLWPFATKPIPEGSVAFDYTYPGIGPVAAGEGWAVGHSPVAMDQLSQYGLVTFENCVFKNWRSEIYRGDYGQPFADTITFKSCWFDSFTGNAVSCSSPLVMRDCLITDTSQGIENDGVNYPQEYTNVTIRDGGVGAVFPSSTGSYGNRGLTRIDGLTCERLSAWGVYISGYMANVHIDRTKIIDCAQSSSYEGFHVGPQFGVKPKDIHVNGLEIGVDQRTTAVALSFSTDDATSTIDNYRVTRTPAAIAAARTIDVAMVGDFAVGTGIRCRGLDFRRATTLGNGLTGSGEHQLHLSEWDGLYQLNANATPAFDLDVGWSTHKYEFKPVGATTLDTPKRFPLGVPVLVLINNQVTIKNNVNIVLAGGVDIVPAHNLGGVMLLRPASGSQRVVEIYRVPA